MIAGMRLAKFIPPAASLSSICHRRLEYGYPTPTRDRDAILQDLEPQLSAMEIHSRGRFGGWKYEVANQDHCFMQGVEVVDHVILGERGSNLSFPRDRQCRLENVGRPWR